MSYKLFIDDERHPVGDDWVIARSSAEAIAIVEINGAPLEIAFDHDLGGDDTSIRFINWFQDAIIDGNAQIPVGFNYSVHSQNPVGARNIKGRMDGILNHLQQISEQSKG